MLVAAGGSLPVWLVLLNLKIRQDINQRQLAEAVGVSEATLTHHLNAMERDGLLTRRRDPSNRRNHMIELAAPGEATFTRLAAAAASFDQQLRTNLQPADISTLRNLLDQLCRNASSSSAGPPWAGLLETEADPTPRQTTGKPRRRTQQP